MSSIPENGSQHVALRSNELEILDDPIRQDVHLVSRHRQDFVQAQSLPRIAPAVLAAMIFIAYGWKALSRQDRLRPSRVPPWDWSFRGD